MSIQKKADQFTGYNINGNQLADGLSDYMGARLPATPSHIGQKGVMPFLQSAVEASGLPRYMPSWTWLTATPEYRRALAENQMASQADFWGRLGFTNSAAYARNFVNRRENMSRNMQRNYYQTMADTNPSSPMGLQAQSNLNRMKAMDDHAKSLADKLKGAAGVASTAATPGPSVSQPAVASAKAIAAPVAKSITPVTPPATMPGNPNSMMGRAAVAVKQPLQKIVPQLRTPTPNPMAPKLASVKDLQQDLTWVAKLLK